MNKRDRERGQEQEQVCCAVFCSYTICTQLVQATEGLRLFGSGIWQVNAIRCGTNLGHMRLTNAVFCGITT